MKTLLIIAIVLVSVAVVGQVLITRSTNSTEQHKYEVIKDYGAFEVRKYEPALFSYVEMPAADFRSNSGQGFRKLAGYIFGGNDKEQKIAMTSPVVMTNSDSMMRMKFMVPSDIKASDLPSPTDTSVHFVEEQEKIMAAIRFGGWASNDSIIKYRTKLQKLLQQNGIQSIGQFSYLGYNPPYQVTNRRNEVVVEVKWPL